MSDIISADDSVPGTNREPALVIVDHGSRRRESNLALEELVEQIRADQPDRIIEPAHMELAEPSIMTAFGRCVARGAERVIVSPFFLLPGRHWDDDIPSLTARAAAKHPHVCYLVAAPLGLHPAMRTILSDRERHCAAVASGRADECELCRGTGRCAWKSSAGA